MNGEIDLKQYEDALKMRNDRLKNAERWYMRLQNHIGPILSTFPAIFVFARAFYDFVTDGVDLSGSGDSLQIAYASAALLIGVAGGFSMESGGLNARVTYELTKNANPGYLYSLLVTVVCFVIEAIHAFNIWRSMFSLTMYGIAQLSYTYAAPGIALEIQRANAEYDRALADLEEAKAINKRLADARRGEEASERNRAREAQAERDRVAFELDIEQKRLDAESARSIDEQRKSAELELNKQAAAQKISQKLGENKPQNIDELNGKNLLKMFVNLVKNGAFPPQIIKKEKLTKADINMIDLVNYSINNREKLTQVMLAESAGCTPPNVPKKLRKLVKAVLDAR